MAAQHNPLLIPADGFGLGIIEFEIFNKADAPLEKTDYRLVVGLMGLEIVGEQRCGVDIVTVLDVSYSMKGKNLEKLKTSMKYLVKKLNSIDRLSIVTFSSEADKLCGLTGMNNNAQAEIEMLIDKLEVNGSADITVGLQTALRVLDARRQHEGRTSAIMLMSSGEHNGLDHPSTVDVGHVPIYTFGLGKHHDSQLLQEIASRTSLNIAFSSCLAGLLSVVVQDLELTVTQMESEIEEVRAGNYDQARVNKSVTIVFGNIYNREKREIIVFLSLPAIEERTTTEILEATISCRPSGGGDLITSETIMATVTRRGSPVTVDPIEVGNEIARADTAVAIQKARKQADANDLSGAQNTMKNAEKLLCNLNRDADELIKAQKYERGRAFALSSELSHNLQRFASRGDATQLVALAIPLVGQFVNQAIEFDQDNDIEVTSTEEDMKEVAAQTAILDAAVEEEQKKLDEQIEALMDKADEEEKTETADKNNLIVAQADIVKHQLGEVIDSLKAIQDLIAALQKPAQTTTTYHCPCLLVLFSFTLLAFCLLLSDKCII
ncbi:hypothetical protein RND81_01G034400 [Saponaria officinalis]|uniref:VWFA domain-containing protein n=1 Tax=Saponaria officinalis TaxID=3572 RepID=A0AAW1NB77_SAPOF